MQRRRRREICQFSRRALRSNMGQYKMMEWQDTYSELIMPAVWAINIAKRVQLSAKQRANDARASDEGEVLDQMRKPPLSSFKGAVDGAGMLSISSFRIEHWVVGVGGSTAIFGMLTYDEPEFVVLSAEIPWMSCWSDCSRNRRQRSHRPPLPRVSSEPS
jgi:hypothetical protein